MPSKRKNLEQPALEKTPTGISGLDEITFGGFPKGRPTLICGSAGCGKTLMAMEFLARGAMEFNEPGVFISFEETIQDLAANVASLGFDLNKLTRKKLIALDFIKVERNEFEENGEYDLEGLFIRLGYAIDSIGAKRVVLDTIETLFGGLPNQAILRSELRRLFYWLKERGVTAVITGERGEGTLTRQGLEEYVSDCVILLDHRVREQVSTRRLRIVKYRGSLHGTNEYPFLIDNDGISVMPITSANLVHKVSDERVSTGIKALDEMVGGRGFYRGSSILISGTPGTGKTSLSAHIAHASALRGEKCLYFAFEEAEQQIVRNMRSIGVDLEPHIKENLLRFHSSRPTLHGLEMHLALMHKMIEDFQPSIVIVDPINNLVSIGTDVEVHTMLVRLADYLKASQVTAVFTSLTSASGGSLEQTDVGFSSLMDTWILLRDIELNGERNRGIYILKSRGMQHSNQIREFIISPTGIDLVEAYLGPEGVLTGSARLAQEIKAKQLSMERRQEIERRRDSLTRKRQSIDLQISALRAELDSEEKEFEKALSQETFREKEHEKERKQMAVSRKVKV